MRVGAESSAELVLELRDIAAIPVGGGGVGGRGEGSERARECTCSFIAQ